MDDLIATVVIVPLTRNLRLADAPGNLVFKAHDIGLSDDSVANVSQIVTIDRGLLDEFVGQIEVRHLALVLNRHRRCPRQLVRVP